MLFQRVVDFLEGVPRDRKRRGELGAHADGLAPLPRKNDGPIHRIAQATCRHAARLFLLRPVGMRLSSHL
jgi:hypothetical protein